MNKLFTKIAALALGAAMAFGVGVAVSAGRKDASPAEATDYNTPTNYNLANNVPTGLTASTSLSKDSNGRGMGKAGTTYTLTTSTSFTDVGKIVVNAATNYGTYSAHSVSATVGGNDFGSAQSFTAKASTNYTIEASKASGVVVVSLNNGKEGTTKTNSIWCLSIDVYTVATPVQTYTVSFVVNTAGYGTVSRSSITGVPSGTSISTSNNTVTINGTTVTATPTANTAQYTYAFTGWSNNTGTVTAARTITANFSRTTNTFTVNGSGVTNGTLSPTSNVSYGAEYNGTITPATDYTYPDSLTVQMGGNTLVADDDYLYDNTEGTLVIGSVTGNLVISGACVPEGTAYTVTYNANSGTVSPASEEVIENGHPSFPTPTRSGYNFKGWQVNGSGTAYTDPEDYTVTDDVTFVASWVAVYTVTFNANGGSSTPPSQSVESGSTFTFPAAPGTKTHYSFDGWTSTGDEPYYAAGATSPAVTGNITYAAHWTEDAKYTVTYSAASPASGSYAHTNNYGGTYTLLAFASLSGITYDSTTYRFKDYTVDGVSRAPGYQFNLSSAKTITVNFELKPIETTYNFVTNFGTYASSWSGYASKTLDGKTTLAGAYAATVTLPYASKQTGTITTMPVLADQATGDVIHISFELTESGYELEDVTVNFVQWAAKDPTMKLFKGTTASGDALDTGVIGTKNSLSATSIGGTTFVVAMNDNGTTRNQVGISSIDVTLKVPATLDSVTTSGQKATFKAGEKFSYGGTLTAHYTQGKADETNKTPAYFKFGASGINPTSAGTSISTSTTMTISDHNSKYIYVVYSEDNVTKWASYQITVGPADPTGIVLSPSSATIGIDEPFSFTDVEVTINPSEYATQNAYEWVMVDDLGLDVEFDVPDIEVHEDSNGEPLIIRCRSTVDNSVYADFELTVSGNPIAVLYDENDDDVTGGSASYFADYGNDIYYHVSASNFGTGVTYTWSSSNSSILSVDDDEGASCGYYIEDGASGTARLSCVVSGSKGSTTVYVDVTITAVSVTSVTWNAPSIDVYSGASMSTASWNVRYSTNSGKTDQVPDSYKIFLGDTEIASNHTWTADDDGETLKVKVGNVYSSSTTVKVTQTIHSVVAQIPGTPISEYQLVESQSDLEEGRYLIVSIEDEKAFDGSLDTLDAGRNNFDVTISDGTVIANDSTASGKYFDLTVENDAWTITSASGANVGHSASGNGMNGTGTNTITVSDGISTILGTGGKGLAYNSASGATSERFRYYTSPAANANHSVSLFKLVEEPGTPTSVEIANVAAHKEAQRVAVKFAKAFNAAMDLTENCTKGLDAAWSTCSSAYNTFKTEAAALGSEKAYAEYYIKYASCEWSDDSGEACIERMLRTYKACVQVHGKTAFMSELVSLGRVVTPVNAISNSGTEVAIIVVTSMIGLSAVGGYFFLRKRKENI